jgi:hypothetical protein
VAGGCSSSDVQPAADATADGTAKTGDAETGEGTGPDASNQDAFILDASILDASILDASIQDASLADAPLPDASAQDATVSDGAAADVSTPDAAESDAIEEANPSDAAGQDGAAADAGTGTAARLLVPGSSFYVWGITLDDEVVYYDRSTSAYYAQPLNGGKATTISTVPPSVYSNYAAVFGNVAFVWTWKSNFIGTLTTWTPGMPQGASLTDNGLAYRYQTIWASADSKHIAYLQNASNDATVGSLYGANADGSGATPLLSSIDINASFSLNLPACFPRLVFRGDYAVVSYCTTGDAGLTPAVQAFSISNGWAPAATVPDLVASRQYLPLDRSPFTFAFAVDPDGTQVAAGTGSGGFQVFPLDGGPATAVDPSALPAPGLSFTGSVTTPWFLLYNDDAGTLKQAYAANPAPQVLVDGGVNYFNALSSDGKWMLVSSARNAGAWFDDLSLVSTQNPGTPVVVASSSQYDGGPIAASGSVFGGDRGFTADSAYALVVTELARNARSQWIGHLRSMSVSPPYTTKLLAKYVFAYVAVRGSKLLVSDNFQDTDGGSTPTVDFDDVDLASSGNPVNVARGVPGDFAVSHDGTQVAYSVPTGSAPGIYVSTLP